VTIGSVNKNASLENTQETNVADAMIRRFCMREGLSTYDPFDVWKTPLGFRVKDLCNTHRRLGFVPAGVLTVLDATVNNRARWFYRRQEFAIVRAWAALILLHTYRQTADPEYLTFARRHLEWLVEHSCEGYSGACWGLGFRYAVDAGLVYDANTPLSTMTPYAIEAFIAYTEVTEDRQFESTIRSTYRFFDEDIEVIEETEDYLVTSYAPMRDRRVVNAVSYVLYTYTLLLPYLDAHDQQTVRAKIPKLYAFVQREQREDGSWPYSPDGRSFIDCFHSCIVVKNLIKAARRHPLPGSQEMIDKGYRYIKDNFFVAEAGLFKRFTLTYTPALVRFDLYDNAEMLNLAKLMGDHKLSHALATAIQDRFVHRGDVFSQIDRWGFRRNKNMLRWAVLPYLYALSWNPQASEPLAG